MGHLRKIITIGFLLLATSLSFDSNATVMVAHKGQWKDFIYPQNSLQSLQAAVDAGFRGIEFDLHMSKDGDLILSHDEGLKAVSNCKGKVKDTLTQDLKNCILDKNTLLSIGQLVLKKVQKPSPMVDLVTVLKVVGTNPQVEMIWLDHKINNPEMALASLTRALDQLRELVTPEAFQSVFAKLILNSQENEVLKLSKKIYPDLKTSLEGKFGAEPIRDRVRYLGLMRAHDYISLNVSVPLGHGPLLTTLFRKKKFRRLLEDFMIDANKRGVPVIAWTENQLKDITYFKTLGFAYLLTDIPGLSH